MRRAVALALVVTAACGSSSSTPDGGMAGSDDASTTVDAPPYPPALECEHAFFAKYFDRDNGMGLEALRDESFTYIASQVDTLHACGAQITLGGMLSLMIYEGGGAKVAFFNDRCAENSYDSSSTCYTNPKARYSYQYGLAPVHTSNFHPCADVAYTSKMRTRLANAITAAGFSATAAEIASVDSQVKTFCPSKAAEMVDYFILTTHSKFMVPTNTTGNDLKNAGVYPFFTPRVVIDLFFALISGSCPNLDSDETAIGVFGGGDATYRTATKQATILKLWRDFKAANCP